MKECDYVNLIWAEDRATEIQREGGRSDHSLATYRQNLSTHTP